MSSDELSPAWRGLVDREGGSKSDTSGGAPVRPLRAAHPERPVALYEPYRRALPPLRPYLALLWRWRSFTWHLARTNLKAQHFDTALGQLWTVLNPLLLAGVYFLLIVVIRARANGGGASTDLMATIVSGLFFFYFTKNSVQAGAGSIVTGSRLILNSAFPRAVLPLAAVVEATLLFLPMLAVYLVMHVALGQPVDAAALAFLPAIIVPLLVFNVGVALLFSTLSVYFRDVTGFLPYLLRMWLYLTPILYTVDDIPESVATWLRLNPLFPFFEAMQDAFAGSAPDPLVLLWATAWAVAALLVGTLLFLSREREFGVRL